jgi:N-hydroxyarylamine O-acetyltransferase
MVDFDLGAYFDRIGFGGPAAPSLETLAAIHRLHTQAIPFENLNPFLRLPVPLDIESLQKKLVRGGRGGWCFEHNLLVSRALQEIGFDVTCLAVRVLWHATSDHIGPRSHMLLLIKLNGRRYVADAGFGGQTLTAPLRLESDIEQQTPHEPFRLLRSGTSLEMQTRIGDAWESLYRFDLQEQFQADYEVTNWYLANHPNSYFVTGLTAARPDAGLRYALRNNQFAVHHTGGDTEHKTLASAAELRATLVDVFRIELPDVPDLDAALNRLTV